MLNFSPAFHCLIYVHLYSRVHIRVCTHVYMKARGWHLVSFSLVLPLPFWDKVSQWTWDSTEWLGWLVTAPRCSSYCFFCTGLQTGVVLFCLLCGYWRFNAGLQDHTCDPSPQVQPCHISIIIPLHHCHPFQNIHFYLSQLYFSFQTQLIAHLLYEASRITLMHLDYIQPVYLLTV